METAFIKFLANRGVLSLFILRFKQKNKDKCLLFTWLIKTSKDKYITHAFSGYEDILFDWKELNTQWLNK